MRLKAGLIAAAAGFAVFAANASASSPTAVGSASPATVAPGRATLLTVAVTPGSAPVSTGVFVSCNLSSIGGDFSQMLVDDGTSGDAHASDLVFSYRAGVSSTAAFGARSLPCVISDAQGRSTFAQIALSIDAVPNQPPTADAGGPYAVDEGSAASLAAGGSDPEAGVLTYAWDLDGDDVFETAGASASFAVDDGPSVHTVRVQVTDDGGLTATAVAGVTVANVAPTAVFHAPGQAFGPFTLSFTSPHDPSAADTAAGFAFAFDCGSGFGAYGAAATASCPAGSGSLAVGGRIRDKDGGTTEYHAAVAAGTSLDGLCGLTRALARRPRVADSLCRKLDKAARAKSVKQRRHHLHAYRAEVRAHTGRGRSKAFSPADGGRLQQLARQLERG